MNSFQFDYILTVNKTVSIISSPLFSQMFYEEVVRHGHDIEKVKDTGCDLYEAHPELKPGVERTTSKNP